MNDVHPMWPSQYTLQVLNFRYFPTFMCTHNFIIHTKIATPTWQSAGFAMVLDQYIATITNIIYPHHISMLHATKCVIVGTLQPSIHYSSHISHLKFHDVHLKQNRGSIWVMRSCSYWIVYSTIQKSCLHNPHPRRLLQWWCMTLTKHLLPCNHNNNKCYGLCQ